MSESEKPEKPEKHEFESLDELLIWALRTHPELMLVAVRRGEASRTAFPYMEGQAVKLARDAGYAVHDSLVTWCGDNGEFAHAYAVACGLEKARIPLSTFSVRCGVSRGRSRGWVKRGEIPGSYQDPIAGLLFVPEDAQNPNLRRGRKLKAKLVIPVDPELE